MWPPAAAPDGMVRRHVWGSRGLPVRCRCGPQPLNGGPGWVTEDGAWDRDWACFAHESSKIFHFIGPSGPLHDVDVKNFYVGERLLVVGPRILDLVDHVEALRRTTKDCVLPVEPRLEGDAVSKVRTTGGRCRGVLNRKEVSCPAELTVFSVVMKNWLPLVLGPAFAILTVYGLSCLRALNSSSNS